ncbi:DUF5690 family protein [Fimbriiglobus ruber]|uniref:Uncharacterized protein n=1 Tax=Fimbriiglobus ruber TaxID=1908690 RepID=A0A225DQ63_9BACT|nr:DUF5690 family protein [Fimbriiglobus ruber]OWK41744.1 hypothetical protein FRUB_03822 [Fimbriiglobus ruber]
MGVPTESEAVAPPRDPSRGGWLATAPPWAFAGYAVAAAFVTYTCAYGVRKPFDAVTFTGEHFLGTRVDLKTACVLGQILGYMMSKYAGARVCSEVPRRWRGFVLAGCAIWSVGALVLFAVAPPGLRPVAMLANGLPLGMVWGLVVRYLEGRTTSDILLVGVSASFILAGALTKDVGLYLLTDGGVAEEWVPAVAGAIFLGPYLAGVWFLNRLPPPSTADVAARAPRADMTAADRRTLLRQLGPGLIFLLAAYLLLTSYRDFRDHYGREIFLGLGYPSAAGLFTRADRWALVGALAALAGLNAIKSHRRALAVVYVLVLSGFALIGLATAAFQANLLTGLGWISLVGVGLYLAYVPFGVVLFERVMAATRFRGTSVFVVQLADGVGYTGSVAIQLYRDLAHPGVGRLAFFIPLSYAVSIAGIVLATAGAIALYRRLRAHTPEAAQAAVESAGLS